MIIDSLRQEHRNIEKLLLVLERELSVFDRGERPDYQVIHAIIAYFLVYPNARAVQRYLLKVIENMDLRPPRAAA